MELAVIVSFILVILGTLVFFFARYKRCPSDKILVIYGKTGGGRSSKCIHGGAAFIVPLIQASEWLDLTPIPIEVKLSDGLSRDSACVNITSTFTVGISPQSGVMENAAERLLGQNMEQIRKLASDIIIGRIRWVLASKEANSIRVDRNSLVDEIIKAIEPELMKVGLRLINENVHDITVESDQGLPSPPPSAFSSD